MYIMLSGYHGSILTWQSIHVFLTAQFIASTDFAHELVAGGEDGDANERDERGKGRADMPPTEYNTEICSIPCE